MTADKEILLVEDDPDDEALTLRTLRKGHLLNTVVVARDGAEALDYLQGTGAYSGRDPRQQPQVVLLDLNLPRISGLQVLQQLRTDERTRLTPVVLLTTSKEEEDLVASHKLGPNSYVRKPIDFGELAKVVNSIGLYWLLLDEARPRNHA